MHCWIKKAIGFCAVLTVLIAFPGCGESEGEEGGKEPIWKPAMFTAPDRKETRTEYYLERQFSLEGDVEAAILETCYAAAQIRPEGCEVTFYSQEDGEPVGFAALPGDYATCTVRSGRQDAAVVFLQPSNSKSREVWLADGEGNFRQLGSIDFSDLPETFFPPEVCDVQFAKDGTVFLWYSVYVLARDSGLERFEDSAEDALYQINRIYAFDGEGRLQGCANEPYRVVSGEITEEGYELQVDGESGWFRETLDAEGRISEPTNAEAAPWLEGSDPALRGTLGKTVYYIKDDALWKWAEETKDSSKVFELVSYGLAQEELRDLRVSSGGQIEMIVQREGETSYLCLEEGESEVTVLTLADIHAQPWSALYKAVTEFNRTHQDCRVEVIDYYDINTGYDDAVTRFQLDLTRGNAPDLLVTSAVSDGEIYSERGILCDLYSFMEHDEELNRDTVVPSVLRAYEENGGLYVLAPSFTLISMYGPKSVLGDTTELSLKEFQKLLKQNPDRYLDAFGDPVGALQLLLNVGMNDFVDWETGSCHFDSKEFREFLEFIQNDLCTRRYVYESGTEGSTQRYLDYRNGKIMLATGIIGDVCDYTLIKEKFGGDVTVVGYPTISGSKTSVLLQPKEVSIMSASQNKEEAWEFMKFYCTSFHLANPEVDGFSILSAQLEEQLQESQKPRYIIDEIGQEQKVPRRSDGAPSSTVVYEIYEATEEDADAVAELIKNSNTRRGRYSGMMDIILEEAAAYFEGDKTAAEVSKVIQGRVRLYLAE